MSMALPVPRLTIDALEALPDDGTRYELLAGQLLVTPSPSLRHQLVAMRLSAMLHRALEGDPVHVVGPGVIQHGTDTQLQPDVFVFGAPVGIPPAWREVAERWLAVEVLSPSSRLYDRVIKRDAYLALGVEEYWVIDPAASTAEVFRRGAEPRRTSGRLVWRPSRLGREVVVELAELFAGL